MDEKIEIAAVLLMVLLYIAFRTGNLAIGFTTKSGRVIGLGTKTALQEAADSVKGE